MADRYVEPGYVDRGYVVGDSFVFPSSGKVGLKFFITDEPELSGVEAAIDEWRETIVDGSEIGVVFASNANMMSLFTHYAVSHIVGGASGDIQSVSEIVDSDEFTSAVEKMIPPQITVNDVVNNDTFVDAVTRLVPDAVSLTDIIGSNEFSEAVERFVDSATSNFTTKDDVEEMISSSIPNEADIKNSIITSEELSNAVENSIKNNLLSIVLGDDDARNNIYSQIVNKASADVENDVSSKAVSIIAEKLRVANIEIRPSDLSQEIITSFGPSMVEEYDNGSRVEYIIDLPEELVGKKYVIDFHVASTE